MSRCKCSHAESIHNRRTGMCWQHPCGCQAYRPVVIEDSAVDPDVIGAYGLEPDSRTCLRCLDHPVQVDPTDGLCDPCGSEARHPAGKGI